MFTGEVLGFGLLGEHMAWRRTLLTVLTLPSVVFPSLVAVPVTAAADELSLSNFQLRPTRWGTALRDRADALAPQKAIVSDIMNDLNRHGDRPDGAGYVCEPGAVTGERVVIQRSLSAGTMPATHPGVVSARRDHGRGHAGDQQCGDGRQPVLVSWYDHNDNADGMVKGVRVSFMNPRTGADRHVLAPGQVVRSGAVGQDLWDGRNPHQCPAGAMWAPAGRRARVCRSISQCSPTEPAPGPRNLTGRRQAAQVARVQRPLRPVPGPGP
jgi:hypothetical protein